MNIVISIIIIIIVLYLGKIRIVSFDSWRLKIEVRNERINCIVIMQLIVLQIILSLILQTDDVEINKRLDTFDCLYTRACNIYTL